MHQNCMMEAEYQAGSACCFCFSTKKSVARNGKSNGVLSPEDHVEWEKNDEILSDMSTFSAKVQERRLKKALEEEGRVSREAERVVQWVKQESARIDTLPLNKFCDEEKEEAINTGFKLGIRLWGDVNRRRFDYVHEELCWTCLSASLSVSEKFLESL